MKVLPASAAISKPWSEKNSLKKPSRSEMQSAWIKHRGPCTMMAFRSYSRGRGHSCWWGHSWWGHSWWWGHWWWGDHCFLRDSSWRNLSRLHEDCFRFEYPLWPENLAFKKTCFFSQAPWCPALAQTETAAASATSADGRMGKVFWQNLSFWQLLKHGELCSVLPQTVTWFLKRTKL